MSTLVYDISETDSQHGLKREEGSDVKSFCISETDAQHGLGSAISNEKVFCPTGPGGGVDPSCSSGGSASSESDLNALADSLGGAEYNKELGAVVPKDQTRVVKELGSAARSVATRIDGLGGDKEDTSEWRNSATSISELHAHAREAEPMLRGLVTESAGENHIADFGPGGKFAVKPLESLDRKVSKAAKDSGEDVTTVVGRAGDTVRGTIIANSPDGVRRAARTLVDKVHEVGGKIVFDNKFASPGVGGYMAVHGDVLLPLKSGGTIQGEIQIHLSGINNGRSNSIKEQSHKIYEKIRTGKGSRSDAIGAMRLMYLAGIKEHVE